MNPLRFIPSTAATRAGARPLWSGRLGLALAAVACMAGPAHALDGVTVLPLRAPMAPQSLKLSLPDLAVQDMRLDGDCRVMVTVVNKGPGRVPDTVWERHTPSSSSVYLTVDGRPWGGATVWKFDPGRRLQERGGSAVYTSTYVVEDSARLKATVDHTGEVVEASESNNSLTKELFCPRSRRPRCSSDSRASRDRSAS